MNKSTLLAASSVLAISSVLGTAALAQSDSGVEEVVVSASRVTIAGYSQPTPVTVVGAAQLEQDAFANVAQSISSLPAVGNYTSPNASRNGVSFRGGWIVNLRNLGNLRTLVLFDGQRSVSSSIDVGGVDLGMIPQALVQRVDVVTGGASAAWGSDAVAGVVNVIINKNFTGLKADIEGVDSTYNNPSYQVSAAWGTDLFGGRGHLILAARHQDDPNTVWNVQNEAPQVFLVNNPNYVAGNGQPQLIHEFLPNDVFKTAGGLINSSPKGTTAAANSLRGIQFVGPGATPSAFNFGTRPALPGNTLSVVSVGGTPNSTDLEANDMASWSSPYHSTNFFALGSYKVTDDIKATGIIGYGDSRILSPSGNISQFYNSFTIKSGNPFIPAAVQTQMTAGGITSFTMGSNLFGDLPATQYNNIKNLYQLSATSGMPISSNEEQQLRASFALDGTLGDDWSWTAYYEHSQTHDIELVINTPVTAYLTNAIDAVVAPAGNTAGIAAGTIVCRDTLTNPGDGCSPANIFGTGNVSQAAHSYFTPPEKNHTSITEDAAEGSMSGKLPWGLDAGNLGVAFGVGYRKEYGFVHPNAIAAVNGFENGNVGFITGEYNVIEGFGEVDAPLLKNEIVDSLDLSAAGRMTSYSTSGLVETWKLGLTSQVDEDIRLRTTWSTDIRAPNLYELYNTPGGSNAPSTDPKTGAPVNITTLVGGNPNLNPEVARTVSGGVVLTPHWVPGLSVSADWYSINIHAAVTSLAAAFILQQCTANLASQYCSYITFGGPPNGIGGQLMSAINTTPHNAQSQSVSGLDVEADYTMDLFAGSLAWHLVGNYTDEETINNPATGIFDFAGSEGAQSQQNGVPKFRSTLAATYTEGPYDLTVQGRVVGAAMLNTAWNGNNTVDNNNVPPEYYLDLRGAYSWNDNVQFYAAIDNVTGVNPPLLAYEATNYYSGRSIGTDYDVLGRAYRVGIRLNY